MPKAEKKTKSSTKTTKLASSARTRKLTKKQTKVKKKSSAKKLPMAGNLRLTAKVFVTLKNNWMVLGGIMLVYLILNIVFASGVSSIANTVTNIKADLNSTSAHAHPLASGVSGFAALIFSAGAGSSSTGSTLQAVLIILQSLVIIWALRHLIAGQKIGIKQAYYHASAPLVPFLLVLAFMFIQLLPITFGSAALAAVSVSLGSLNAGITILFGLIFLALAAWSIYMLSASIFALYIVTLPDMKPRDALRSAKKLVRYRRLQILRRVIFLPVLILLTMSIIVVPLILYATSLVVPVFYLLSVIAFLFTHTYFYSLYRELLA